LHDTWQQHHAHFGQFYGWERPLYFGKKDEPRLTMQRPAWFDQVGTEVMLAHQHAAVFDLSTFGKIDVTGQHAEQFLNRVCANNMSRAPGRAIYTAMLNANGGFESDLTALRLADDHYRLYVGTGSIKRDMAWLRTHLPANEVVTLEDVTERHAVLALMGPDTTQIATQLGASQLTSLKPYRHCTINIKGIEIQAARISYIGEPGWELTCATADVSKLYATLADLGAQPAGLFAQSSMRIEKRFLAYGHDLDTDINPLESGLSFAIDWESDFIGKKALLKQRDKAPLKKIVCLKFDDNQATPLGNEPCYVEGQIIGKTTSAAYGYRVGSPIALALVNTNAVDLTADLSLEVDIAQRRFTAAVTEKLL